MMFMDDLSASQTGLPVATKPPVDRRQLQQIITMLAEGVILFDTDGGIVWANAAALAAFGAEAFEDLGSSETTFFQRFNIRNRNHKPLRDAELPLARLLNGEALEDRVVEASLPGEDAAAKRTLSLRGGILTDRDGTPESFVLVVHDLTGQVSAEERFERTFNANPAPAIICRVADLRFIKVNPGFLEMTGYAASGVLGRSVYEIDVLAETTNRDDAIARLNGWRTIPQGEAMLRLADGSTKPVIVAGQPIEMGEERCMLFTFMDLSPRKQAEDLLRQSEERFAKLFRLAPVPMILVTFPHHNILDLNDACLAAMGISPTERQSQPADGLAFWPDKARRNAFERALRSSGSVSNFEAELRLGEEVCDYLISAETVSIAGQDCVLMVMLDISERKRTESELMAAIDTVMKDTSWFTQSVMEKLANLREPRRVRRDGDLASLTLREREVLEMICQGMSDAEIARSLGLSRNTVRNHVATLYAKIDIHRRAEVIIWARERGITGPRNGKTNR
jgi:PAS domain S-box-containing protein